MTFVVGLTGGIGCGKSTVSAMFAARGAAVVDTDGIAHRLTRPGGAAIEPIRQAFGAEFIGDDGALDRTRMRQRVFTDAAARKALEAILHPLIRAQARAEIAAATTPYALLVVPLLIETGAYRELTQRVLVVDCPEADQLGRTMRRSGIAEAEVRAIMAAQATRTQRLAAADDVVNNDTDIAGLERQVARLHQRYLELGGARQAPANAQ
ncbi:MAG TPA: dephospho-CoA kinase [Burkholderiales bacterium]|nr:dephospho-CoA kinase [Burkholderiales bacterium]